MYNIVIGLVNRHPKSEWSFGVQMDNCLKFDNSDLEQNKQGVIVKNMASDTQSCMQGQSWQCLREFNHQKRTMDTMFPNDLLPQDTWQGGSKLSYAKVGTEALCYY